MAYSFRPLRPSEYKTAVRLWTTVFNGSPAYFERYFRADPWFCEGDCLGAWIDETLVSAVHVCRRPLDWQGETVWCGGIANVATLEEHRRQGLSRVLLAASIVRMEQSGLHFSLLGTGVPGHYAPLGWRPLPVPQLLIDLKQENPVPPLPGEPASVTPEIERLYRSAAASPLSLQRRHDYFQGWVGWGWERSGAAMLTLPDRGYVIVTVPEEPSSPVRLREWAAPGDEIRLIELAASWALGQDSRSLFLPGLPHGGAAALQSLGRVQTLERKGAMMRNVSLSDARYQELGRLYETGAARWWPDDGF